MAPNKLYFVVSFLATAVLVWIMLTTVSGRWSREKGASKVAWTETGLWRHCSCSDNLESAGCTKDKDYVRTMEAFSVLSGIFTALAVTVLLNNIFLTAAPTKGSFTVITVFITLSLLCSVVTWTVFSGYYKKRDLCVSGQPSLKDLGFDLDWGYGVRLVEFGFLGLALAVSLVLTCGAPEAAATSSSRYVLFVVLLFVAACTVFTTSGRGWLKNNDLIAGAKFEVGVFDSCACIEVQDMSCSKLKKSFETAEAFSVISLFFQFFFAILLLHGPASKGIQLVFGAFSTVSITLVWILYSESFSQAFCGGKLKDTEKLHWAFGLQIVACAVSVLSLLLVATASADEPAKEQPKATEPAATEPAH